MVELNGAGLKRAALGLACLLLGGSALALPKYRIAAARQLGYDGAGPLWQYSRGVLPCITCHVSAAGGAPWNAFGQALQAGFRATPGADFGAVLHAVLRENGDADADGYPDALEVFAHTLPGDPASRPGQPLPRLEAAFQAAGGVAAYAPKGAPKGKR